MSRPVLKDQRNVDDVEKLPASVWVPWYFRQGIFTLVTAPLFLLLAAALSSQYSARSSSSWPTCP